MRRSIAGVSAASVAMSSRRPDPRGVHGRHDDRRSRGHGSPGPDHLGAEHVRVEQVDLLAAQVGGELVDRRLVIGLIDDLDLEAQPPQPLDG